MSKTRDDIKAREFASGFQAGASAQEAEIVAFWSRKAAVDNAPEWAPSWVASVTSHIPLVVTTPNKPLDSNL